MRSPFSCSRVANDVGGLPEEGQAVPPVPAGRSARPARLASALHLTRSASMFRVDLLQVHNGAEHAFLGPLTRPARQAVP